ncbi:MAG: hypothetical protein ABS84_14910 [Rubrivivax sp. SCN 71-131]|nr:MAG: hypothetical protein ABS84_14910 [Rubrivivax sp. SCN 71-131]
MAFKLAISDIIDVPVKASLADGGKKVTHAFTLHARRIDAEPLREALNDSSVLIGDFLREHVVGWGDQRLVLDEETGAPASFSDEAFAAMRSVPGIERLIFESYLVAAVAADGAAARAKN